MPYLTAFDSAVDIVLSLVLSNDLLLYFEDGTEVEPCLIGNELLSLALRLLSTDVRS